MSKKLDADCIIPKTSSKLEDFVRPMEALADAVEEWVSQPDFVKRVGSLEKKHKEKVTLINRATFPSYFGFIDIRKNSKDMTWYKLNAKGYAFLAAYKLGDMFNCTKFMLNAIEEVDFGVNIGVPSSNTSIQAPLLAMNIAQKMGIITAEMLTFAILQLEKTPKMSFDELIALIKICGSTWSVPEDRKAQMLGPCNQLLNVLANTGVMTTKSARHGVFSVSSLVNKTKNTKVCVDKTYRPIRGQMTFATY